MVCTEARGRMAEPADHSIFEAEPDTVEDVRLDAKADADIVTGRFVHHADVVRWLQSWGTPNKLPRPQPKL